MNSPKPNQAEKRVPPVAGEALPIAYIKAFELEGRHGYAIHAASGEMIGWCEDRNVAFAAAAQNDLLALSVH